MMSGRGGGGGWVGGGMDRVLFVPAEGSNDFLVRGEEAPRVGFLRMSSFLDSYGRKRGFEQREQFAQRPASEERSADFGQHEGSGTEGSRGGAGGRPWSLDSLLDAGDALEGP